MVTPYPELNRLTPTPADISDIYVRARELENLLLEGVSCHIGSLLLDPDRGGVGDAASRGVDGGL